MPESERLVEAHEKKPVTRKSQEQLERIGPALQTPREHNMEAACTFSI